MFYFNNIKKKINNFLIIVYIKKIIYTFFPSILKQSRMHKDHLIWVDEKFNKSSWYSKLGQDEDFFINKILKFSHPDDRVLDICCNQGRFLFALHKYGYKKLHGFDIMKPAIEILKSNKLYNENYFKVENCLAQNFFENKDDNSYDWAITYTATIELIHPSFDIFREISRTVKKGIIFVLNFHDHTYPRFYNYLLNRNNFTLVYKKKIISKNIRLIVYKKNDY